MFFSANERQKETLPLHVWLPCFLYSLPRLLDRGVEYYREPTLVQSYYIIYSFSRFFFPRLLFYQLFSVVIVLKASSFITLNSSGSEMKNSILFTVKHIQWPIFYEIIKSRGDPSWWNGYNEILISKWWVFLRPIFSFSVQWSLTMNQEDRMVLRRQPRGSTWIYVFLWVNQYSFPVK